MHPLRMLLKWECWALVASTGCVIGGGALVVVNLGQMCEALFARAFAAALAVDASAALSVTASLAAAAVTLFSVAQTLGRALAGLAADALLGATSGRERVAGIALAALLMAAAHAALALASGLSDALPGAPLSLANITVRGSGSGSGSAAGGSASSSAAVATFGFDGLPSLPVRGVVGVVEALLLLGVATSGVAFGAVWPLLVVTVRDLWGVRWFAVNFMVFDGVTAGVATVALGIVLPSAVYSGAILPDNEYTCLGGACYLASHCVVAALCVGAAAVAAALAWRHKLGLLLCKGRTSGVDAAVLGGSLYT